MEMVGTRIKCLREKARPVTPIDACCRDPDSLRADAVAMISSFFLVRGPEGCGSLG